MENKKNPMSEETLNKNIKYWLLWAYAILEGILASMTIIHLYGAFYKFNWLSTENIFTSFFAGGVLFVVTSFLYGLINSLLFDALYNVDEANTILFIQVLMTTIFVFSLAEETKLFLKLSMWWCIISPIGILLSSASSRVPIFQNKPIIAMIGIFATVGGYISSMIEIPVLKLVDVALTMFGALLTVISVGSPTRARLTDHDAGT